MAYRHVVTLLLTTAFLFVISLNTSAGEPSKQGIEIPFFKPPQVGKPKTRLIGGGSRGTGSLIKLSALTPEETGLTTQEQPSLFWYLSEKTPHTLELIISGDRAKPPLVSTRLRPPTQPGIQRIRLSDYNIRLKPGVTYRWFVALVPDLERRSKDIITGGGIERIAVSETLRSQLHQTAAPHMPHLYAKAGLWYDAFGTLSDLIDVTPADLTLRQQRAALLSQVGLETAAAYDMAYRN